MFLHCIGNVLSSEAKVWFLWHILGLGRLSTNCIDIIGDDNSDDVMLGVVLVLSLLYLCEDRIQWLFVVDSCLLAYPKAYRFPNI
jgi:hypothetical protein